MKRAMRCPAGQKKWIHVLRDKGYWQAVKLLRRNPGLPHSTRGKSSLLSWNVGGGFGCASASIDDSGGVSVGLQLCDGHSWERLKARLKKEEIGFAEGPCPEFRIDSAIVLRNVYGINIVAYRDSWTPLEPLRASNAILPTKLGHAM